MFGLFACDTGENNKDDKENNDDVNINIPTEYKGYYKEIVAALNNAFNNVDEETQRVMSQFQMPGMF